MGDGDFLILGVKKIDFVALFFPYHLCHVFWTVVSFIDSILIDQFCSFYSIFNFQTYLKFINLFVGGILILK